MTANQGKVVSVTRSYISICDYNYRYLLGRRASSTLEVVVGDDVNYELNAQGEAMVKGALERKNLLSRADPNRVKRLCANIDHMFVITAVEPLFNSSFIDRILAVASSQGIPATLVVNKTDLGVDSSEELIKSYGLIGVSVLLTSAKCGRGMEGVKQVLEASNVRLAALAGVSGVGKSTILNYLIPSAEQRTQAVSGRTGQGRQTTSQSYAYIYSREGAEPLFLVDLPGVQNFGVCHLTKEDIRQAFKEFHVLQQHCEFNNCMHLAEPNCAVRTAVKEGMTPEFRYESYVSMLKEVEVAEQERYRS